MREKSTIKGNICEITHKRNLVLLCGSFHQYAISVNDSAQRSSAPPRTHDSIQYEAMQYEAMQYMKQCNMKQYSVKQYPMKQYEIRGLTLRV